MKYYVYTLFSLKDRKLYTGYTNNLIRRLADHNTGQVISTSNRRPLKLIHYEYFLDKEDAMSREIFLKSGFGRKNLIKSLQRTLVTL